MSTKTIQITVNGTVRRLQVEPRTLLVDAIRETLGLTGTHVGCAIEGRCGACTVIYNGKTVKSCLMLAVQADGAEILTIEGLANGHLHPLQEAFWSKHGLQCGYCTPGMVMSAYQLLKSNPQPSSDEIRQALVGNLCRCTGYQKIVEAVQEAAGTLAALPPEERKAAFPV